MSGLYLETYRYPGRWMDDARLAALQDELRDLTRRCLGEIPEYGVYLKAREPFRDRIVTVVRDPEQGGRVVAFNAMVRWHARVPGRRRPQLVVHLGLVLVAPEHRGRKVMYGLYHRPLFWVFLGRLFWPFWITSTTMEPVIVGSVADSFSHVHPHYRPDGPDPTEAHRAIARQFVAEHGHEIGIWDGAWLDEEASVIRDSSLGACQELMVTLDEAARYKIESCNAFCARTLDYTRGDEILQVGRADLAALFRSGWWFARKLRRRLRGGRP